MEQRNIFTRKKGLTPFVPLEHQHGRRFTVLGQQYARRNVM